jgi:deferrochelatase/peroxidase EfeB
VPHSFVSIAIPFNVELSDRVEKYLDELGRPLLDEHVKSTLSPGQASYAKLDELGSPLLYQHVKYTPSREASYPKSNLRIGLDNTQIIHFLSITVVRGEKRRKIFKQRERQQTKAESSFIILEASVDGSMDCAVNAITDAMKMELCKLLAVAELPTSEMRLSDFLHECRLDVGQGWFTTRRLRPGLNYDGTPGMTVQRIKSEASLADRIATMLNESVSGSSALTILEQVRSNLWVEGEKWAFVAEPAPCLQASAFGKWAIVWGFLGSAISALVWPFLLLLAAPIAVFLISLAMPECRARWHEYFLAAALATGAVLAIEVLSTIGGYFWLRHREKTDLCDNVAPTTTHVEKLMRRETFGAQNHLAASSIMKPGWFRWLTLRIGLWAAGATAAYKSRPSFLAETGVIHFARWILLPGKNKLLFMSNYDGAWESYLEDFIEEAHEGVTGIWSNTQGFPKTEKLFWKGATDGDRLKWWTRRQQHPSWVWYVAYPSLSLARIRINAAIRQGIAAARTEADAADWLSCFGSSPRPANALQLSEVSTLVVGGLRRLRTGTCVFVRISSDKVHAKRWLAGIAEEVSYGDQLNALKALVVGVAPSALMKLGLTEENLTTFSVPFQQGNAAPWRARTLGDIGRDDPEHWLWGAGAQTADQTATISAGTQTENQVDAVILIYAWDPDQLSELEKTTIDQIERFGGHVVLRLKLKDLPEQGRPKEPFGFLDGISNPIIRGIRSTKSEDAADLVDLGEFILGYPDNLGYMPPSPSVPPDDDPKGFLPSAGADLLRQRPDFSEPSATARHDLGMNGTFLVVRQLEQDTSAFEEFLADAERKLITSGHQPKNISGSLRDWIAAKMVGRWRDGTSLVRHPDSSGTATFAGHRNVGDIRPDNDFSFRIEDPNGLRCPLGAHIRRANPRDSFVSGLEHLEGGTKEKQFVEQIKEQLRIVNRHRILRVGRPYDAQECRGAPDNRLDKPGLLFMCLNADIERQFEFVQQSWVLGPSFHGLQDEIDPLVGNRQGSETFTIPTPDGPLRINDIKDFVRVRGGGYFFLPGRQALRFLANFEESDGAAHLAVQTDRTGS